MEKTKMTEEAYLWFGIIMLCALAMFVSIFINHSVVFFIQLSGLVLAGVGVFKIYIISNQPEY